MKISVWSEKGANKVECEDAALIGTEIRKDIPFCICAADGVGGNQGGMEASSFLIERLAAATPFTLSEITVRQYFLDVNRGLVEYARRLDGKGNMATTATGLFMNGSDCYLFHSGNTRLYALQGQYLKQMTKDQTTCQWLIDRGEYEAAENCNKNEITGCFGGGTVNRLQNLQVGRVFEQGLPKLLVLTSDGIHDYIDIDILEEKMLSGQEMCKIARDLITIAGNNGSVDDKTIMIADS